MNVAHLIQPSVTEKDMKLVAEALKTVSLISMFAALSMPNNPSQQVIESAFSRIHDICDQLKPITEKIEDL